MSLDSVRKPEYAKETHTAKKKPAKKKQGQKVKKTGKSTLKKEEEERRLKEEEEARLIAKQEEQERLERKQKEEEEQLRLELKDRERREDELNELRMLLEDNQRNVNTWEANTRETAEWDRYLLCNGIPNPFEQHEVNTFISWWNDDPNVDIQTVLKQCDEVLKLIEDLELLLSQETAPRIIDVYQEAIQSLQSLIHDKHLLATDEILKSLRNSSNENIEKTLRDDNVTLCLWLNIAKNLKVKGHHFQEVGMSFELPTELTMCDISVRILHTHYDHLSHLSLRAQAQNKTPVTEVDTETPQVLEDGEMSEEDEKREEDKDDLQSLHLSEERKSTVSSRSGKRSKSSKQKEEEEAEEEEADHSENIVEGENSSAEDKDKADPEPAVVQPVTDSTESNIVDLHQYTPLGGVFYFDLFQLPPKSVKSRGWVITPILATGLQHFPYPSEQPTSSVSEQQENSNTQSHSHVGVTVPVPDSVIFMQEPQVARWDGQNWRTDRITETSYNSTERCISFKMDSFSAFTLLQETHMNMPFQHWELRPRGQDLVTLTITTAHTEVRISVKENQYMLEMDEALGLNHVRNKWMILPALQTAMRRAGVNVFVNDYSDKYVTVRHKDPLIEHSLYEQMALVATTFAFSWSHWNAQCGQEHLIVQACEHQGDGPVPGEAWSLYLVGAQRSQRLKMTEKSDEYTLELAEESEFHSTFLHMLRDVLTVQGSNRLGHTQSHFVDAVQKLLCATRLLTFS